MQNLLAVFTVYVFNRKHYFRQFLTRQNENCQFQLKFYTKTISNIQNSMVVFTFFCFRWETPLFGKFSPKNPNCQFLLKFGAMINWNIQNSMVVFTFLSLDGKQLFVGGWGGILSKSSNVSVLAEI